MREPASQQAVKSFLRRLGEESRREGRVYLTGGACAVLIGWRASTVDVDIKLAHGAESLLRAIPRLKEELQINVELAAPDDFIPPLPDWETRSLFVERHARIDFYHYDFYAQALAKIERAHALDLVDVHEMLARGLVERGRALALFHAIEPELYRYPAIDPVTFRKRVEQVLAQ